MSFFAAREKLSRFDLGPPLHDALTLMFVSKPELFTLKRHRVDVELGSTLTAGETVVDLQDRRQTDDSWGPTGKNCLVAQDINVSSPLSDYYHILIDQHDGQVQEFYELLLDAVHCCDKASPLNAGANYPSIPSTN